MLDKLPASCPPLRAGFGFDLISSQISGDVSAGAPRFELWTTDTPPVYTLQFLLTKTAYRIFSNFYHNTLVEGSKWFEADLRLNNEDAPQTMELHFTVDSTLSPYQNGKLYGFSMKAVARNADFTDDSEFLIELDDLIGAGYSEQDLYDLFVQSEIWNDYAPFYWNA